VPAVEQLQDPGERDAQPPRQFELALDPLEMVANGMRQVGAGIQQGPDL
jgi:hypothetical protein